MAQSRVFIRYIDFDELLERFFISAVLAILSIRLFLYLTGYPQLGGDGLHIAHMLWGGLLMLGATVLLLTYLNLSIKRFAAIIAGLGFGTFIDELGKFITSDNNYFYKPTIALIYIIFIVLFLVFRTLHNRRAFSEAEYLSNSIELLREETVHKLDPEDKWRILYYLQHSDRNSRLTQALEQLALRLQTTGPPESGMFTRLKEWILASYQKLVRKKWFINAVSTVFVIEAVAAFLFIFFLIIFLRHGRLSAPSLADLYDVSLVEILTILSAGAAGILVILGARVIRRSRFEAYHYFRRSVLVSIFFVQVFSFYHHQMHAFLGLLINLLLLTTLNLMIEDEQAVEAGGRYAGNMELPRS